LNKIEGDEGVEGVGVEGYEKAVEVEGGKEVEGVSRMIDGVGGGQRESRETKGAEEVRGRRGSWRSQFGRGGCMKATEKLRTLFAA
jgi:hypothetical protein